MQTMDQSLAELVTAASSRSKRRSERCHHEDDLNRLVTASLPAASYR